MVNTTGKNNLASFATAALLTASSAQANIGYTADNISQETNNIIGEQTEKCQNISLDDVLKYTEDYTVQGGDSLGKIVQDKGHGLTLNEFMSFRLLVDGNNTTKIQIGEKLKVPQSKKDVSMIRAYNLQKASIDRNTKLNALFNLGKIEELNKELSDGGFRLFPNERQDIGSEGVASGLVGCTKVDPMGYGNCPIGVDYEWAHLTSCAATIRHILKASTTPEKWTDEQRDYFLKSGVDAWKLEAELEKAFGYTRLYSYLQRFNLSQIGTKGLSAIKSSKRKEYNSDISELLRHIDINGEVGDVMFMRFVWSGFHSYVALHNKGKPRSEWKANTHQAICVGPLTIDMDASDIYEVNGKEYSGSLIERTTSSDVVSVFLDFVQQRSGFPYGLSNNMKDEYTRNLPEFSSSINMTVNGEEINLGRELRKKPEDRIQVSPEDKVGFTGKGFADGYHVKSVNIEKETSNAFIENNNGTRVIYSWEPALGGYDITEYTTRDESAINFEDDNSTAGILAKMKRLNKRLNQTSQSFKSNIIVSKTSEKGVETPELHEQLKVSSSYMLVDGEMLYRRLMEAILIEHFGKIDDLNYSEEELKLLNQMELQKKFIRYQQIILAKNERDSVAKDRMKSTRGEYTRDRGQFLKLKWARVKKVIESLSPGEDKELKSEYARQFKALQLKGYLQSGNELNSSALNVYAFIPYFDTSNVDSIYVEYVEQRKAERLVAQSSCNVIGRDFEEIVFFPGDTNKSVLNQIKARLETHESRYPVFGALKHLNGLQQVEFLERVIDKSSGGKLDISGGEVPESGHVVFGLELANTVLTEIISTSPMEERELSAVDETTLGVVAYTQWNLMMFRLIIARESYNDPGSMYKRKIIKSELARIREELGDELADNLRLPEIKSASDAQIRILNLRDKNTALIKWPTLVHLIKAIGLLDNPTIKKESTKIMTTSRSEIENDDKLIAELVELIKQVTDENRIELGQLIYRKLFEIFDLDDGKSSNIKGKVIAYSLAQDYLDEIGTDINNWIFKTGLTLDEINASINLKSRYQETQLLTYHSGTKTGIRVVGHNYILRTLEALGEDVSSDEYPTVEEKAGTGSLIYNSRVIKEHFGFYIDKLDEMEVPEEDKVAVDSLRKILEDFINNGITSTRLYELMKNEAIVDMLQRKKIDSHILPTVKELGTRGGETLRGKFMKYLTYPENHRPPVVGKQEEDTKKLYMAATGLVLGGIASLLYGVKLIYRRIKTGRWRKLKKKNK